jgi:hypothetical protein
VQVYTHLLWLSLIPHMALGIPPEPGTQPCRDTVPTPFAGLWRHRDEASGM